MMEDFGAGGWLWGGGWWGWWGFWGFGYLRRHRGEQTIEFSLIVKPGTRKEKTFFYFKTVSE
jgi:hypothetical protein